MLEGPERSQIGNDHSLVSYELTSVKGHPKDGGIYLDLVGNCPSEGPQPWLHVFERSDTTEI